MIGQRCAIEVLGRLRFHHCACFEGSRKASGYQERFSTAGVQREQHNAEKREEEVLKQRARRDRNLFFELKDISKLDRRRPEHLPSYYSVFQKRKRTKEDHSPNKPIVSQDLLNAAYYYKLSMKEKRLVKREAARLRALEADGPGASGGQETQKTVSGVSLERKNAIARLPSWLKQKVAETKKREGVAWAPRKRLSPDALTEIRAIYKQNPDYDAGKLADMFKVSPEAMRRILRSKWQPKTEKEAASRAERWRRRGERIINMRTGAQDAQSLERPSDEPSMEAHSMTADAVGSHEPASESRLRETPSLSQVSAADQEFKLLNDAAHRQTSTLRPNSSPSGPKPRYSSPDYAAMSERDFHRELKAGRRKAKRTGIKPRKLVRKLKRKRAGKFKVTSQ